MEAVKRLAIYLIAIGLAAALGYGWWAEYYHWPAVTFVEVRTDRVALEAEVESYQSPEQFLAGPVGTACAWQRRTDSARREPGLPPFVVEILSCPGFKDLDLPGAMEVTFFNNRLMATTFYPRDPDEYRQAFEAHFQVHLNRFDRVAVGDNREAAWLDQDQTRAHVELMDSRLWHERSLWMKRY